ncbi:MAG: hypothetical protein RL662_2282 [Bacteroidota bacterium]|jgi:energy-coupling factor transporter ATP-binding protein EcfA2/uncharacterized protein YoxC
MEQKINSIHELKKEEDIHLLLEELLPEMGFNDVTITHERGNRPEDGKDVICSKYDDIEEKKEWFAFVVKKGAIKGTSAMIQDVQSQVKDCFEYEYKSLATTNERVRISKVKIVTNYYFSSGAEDKILRNNFFDKANIDFWSDKKLINFIDKYYPAYWVKGSKSYKKYVEIFKEKIETDDVRKRFALTSNKITKLIDATIIPTLLEKTKDEEGRITFKKRKSESVLKLPNNAFIIGQAGSGKSTLFKTLAKEVIEQNSLRNDSEFYPIIINFSRLHDAKFDIATAISNYFKQDIYSALYIDGKKIIDESKCVIFLDAFDEIASNTEKEKAVESLCEFAKKYPTIKVICTSRPSDFINEQCAANGFTTFELDNINRREVEHFIDTYFKDDIIKSKRLLKSLKDSGILDRLPKTPLTIALITIIFDENEVEIPSTITDLYMMFTDILVGKTEIKSTIGIIEVNIKHRILSHLAKEMHFKKIISIEHKDAIDIINKYLKSRGQEVINAEELIVDFISKTGLLCYDDECKLQFKHLSFQEFFTAYELFHHRQSERGIFIRNFNKLWWQNVALFYAGFSKDAPKLLQEILEESIPNTFIEKINNIAGIGRLLQALYNTPIEIKKLGLARTTEESINAINFLVETTEDKYQPWKKFSKYAIYQMFGGWFAFNHHSITLLESFNQCFEELFEKHKSLYDEKEIFELEYKLYLLSMVAGSDSFLEYKNLRRLIESSKTNDLSFLALTEVHIRETSKLLSKEQRSNEDIQKIKKKIKNKLDTIGNISHIVNKSLGDITKKNNVENKDED